MGTVKGDILQVIEEYGQVGKHQEAHRAIMAIVDRRTVLRTSYNRLMTKLMVYETGFAAIYGNAKELERELKRLDGE